MSELRRQRARLIVNGLIRKTLHWLPKSLFILLPIPLILSLLAGISALTETSYASLLLSNKLTIVNLTIASFAIIAGGSFAFYRLEAFRTFQPHLTIAHKISHRAISAEYVHIAVTATLHNSSKVKIDIREGFFLWQRIAPLPNEDVEALYNQVFANKESGYIPWAVGDAIERIWNKNDVIVEPGETHQEICEFIISTDVASIAIYTYFYNPKFSKYADSAQGWGATSFYDI